MKSALVLMLSFAAICCAADEKADRPQQKEKKRLESVTWDLKTHKLVWVVQKGTEVNGEFTPGSSERYEISPDDAVMEIGSEKRGFTEEEAASLHKLLDTLSLYCAESVVWWDQGQGVKLKDDGTPSGKPGEPKGQKVEERRKQQPPRKFQVKNTDVVARLGGPR